VILERFRLPPTPPPLLKEIDRALLATGTALVLVCHLVLART